MNAEENSHFSKQDFSDGFKKITMIDWNCQMFRFLSNILCKNTISSISYSRLPNKKKYSWQILTVKCLDSYLIFYVRKRYLPFDIVACRTLTTFVMPQKQSALENKLMFQIYTLNWLVNREKSNVYVINRQRHSCPISNSICYHGLHPGPLLLYYVVFMYCALPSIVSFVCMTDK